MDRTLYRVRRADGGEVEVDSLAAAKKQYPDGTILYRVGFDAVGNPQQQPYLGGQPGEPKPGPSEEDADPERKAVEEPHPAIPPDAQASKATVPPNVKQKRA